MQSQKKEKEEAKKKPYNTPTVGERERNVNHDLKEIKNANIF